MNAQVHEPTHWDEERRARATLTWLAEAANPRLAALVARRGAVEVMGDLAQLGVESWTNRARNFEIDALVETAHGHGIRFVVPGDDEWPAQLDELNDVCHERLGGAPLGLWLRGPVRLDQCAGRALALVGARSCTSYGEQVATDLALDLAGGSRWGGWTVLSGGAFGIDGWAHRGALAAEGRTAAILAGGLDRPYPSGNSLLFERLAAEQLLISEVPPGLRPTKVGFLARNRLLAALSLGTVVVEAAARSGALNTARWAAHLNRMVMAVPGPVHSALSIGTHRLVRDHQAELVTCAAEVVGLVSPLARQPELPVGGHAVALDALAPHLMAIREVLPGGGGMPAGVVSGLSGRPMAEVLASLGELAELGFARVDQMGEWHLAHPG